MGTENPGTNPCTANATLKTVDKNSFTKDGAAYTDISLIWDIRDHKGNVIAWKVKKVVKNSFSAQLGFKDEDSIEELNGKYITTVLELPKLESLLINDQELCISAARQKNLVHWRVKLEK